MTSLWPRESIQWHYRQAEALFRTAHDWQRELHETIDNVDATPGYADRCREAIWRCEPAAKGHLFRAAELAVDQQGARR